jgi:hypothetical protein
MSYKVDYKQGYKFLPHGDKGLHKLQIPMKHIESTFQSLIDLCGNTMPHQMKGIKNGRHDVWRLLLNTYKMFLKKVMK